MPTPQHSPERPKACDLGPHLAPAIALDHIHDCWAPCAGMSAVERKWRGRHQRATQLEPRPSVKRHARGPTLRQALDRRSLGAEGVYISSCRRTPLYRPAVRVVSDRAGLGTAGRRSWTNLVAQGCVFQALIMACARADPHAGCVERRRRRRVPIRREVCTKAQGQPPGGCIKLLVQLYSSLTHVYDGQAPSVRPSLL